MPDNFEGIRSPFSGFRGLSLGLGLSGYSAGGSITVSIGSGPVITGTALSATINGLQGGETVTYQWTDDGANITGALSSGYTPAIGTDSVGDASAIGLTITVNGGDPITSVPRQIQYAAGSVTESGLGDWTIDDDALNINFATDFNTTNLTSSYVITGLPSGAVDDGDGTISGTPDGVPESTTITVTFGPDQYGNTIVGSYPITTAYRAQATGGADLDLSFVAGSAITPTDLTANWTLNGNTLTFAVDETLPTGLSVSSSGQLSGTPTTETADASYTLRGTDEYGRDTTDTFTLAISTAPSAPDPSTGDVISAFDFTTATPQTDATLFPASGLGWTNESIAGASSTRSWVAGPAYQFFVDGADGANPEKAALRDTFTAVTGYDPIAPGDVLDVTMELQCDGFGFLFFDFEQAAMDSDAGTLAFNGVRLGVDPSGIWTAIRSELSSGYADFTEVVGAPAFPLNTWVTIRVIVDANNDSTGRIRIYQDGVLCLDDTGPNMWSAADVLASDGITLDTVSTPVAVDAIESGITALYNSVTGSRTMQMRSIEARAEYAPAVEAITYLYENSLVDYNRDPATPDDVNTDARNWIARFVDVNSNVYSDNAEFGFIDQWNLPPVGGQGGEDTTDLAISGWTGMDAVNNLILVHDNFDCNQRAPETNAGGVILGGSNYVTLTNTIFQSWETNAAPATDRTYWIFTGYSDQGPHLAGAPSTATPTEINNWIAFTLDEVGLGYAGWSDDYVAQVQAANPTLDVRHMDANRVFISTYQNTALGNIAFGDLFEDDSPHGFSDAYIIIGAIMYTYIYGERPPAGFVPAGGTGISTEITNNWSAILDHIYDTINEFAPVTTGQLIVNDYFVDAWTRNQPFADVMRLGQRAVAPTTRDANGWPTGTTEYFALTTTTAADTSLSGTYRIEWEGTGTVTTNLASQTSGAGFIEGDFTAGGGALQINITANSAAPNNIRNITCTKTDNIGLTFRPEYVADIAGIRALRFMDWQGTNASDQELWADRPTADVDTWASGGPWRGPSLEVMVQLANETGIRPWLCIPHLATDNYVTEMATYIRDNLNPALTCIIEYSNECWNTGGAFTQSTYFQNQAAADPDLLDSNQWMQWAGRRAAECMDIFTSVFSGQTSRIVRACGMQTDFLFLSELFLDAPDLAVTPADSFDVIGVTSYVFGDPSLNYSATNWNTILATDTASGEAQALRQMYDWALADVQGDLPTNWAVWDAEATTRSKELWMYEGGIHMAMQGITTNDNARAETLLQTWVRSDYYADIYQRIIAEWESLTNSVYVTQYATYSTDDGNPYYFKEYPGATALPIEETLDAHNTNTTLPTITLPEAPAISGVPTIAGTETEGQTLTATAASVTGNPSPTRTWQWERDGAEISGATASTYSLVVADVGAVITVVQTETNDLGVDTAESAGTGPIQAIGGAWTAPSVSSGDTEATITVGSNQPAAPSAPTATAGDGEATITEAA